MNSPIDIFDRKLLRARRNRAAPGFAGHDFLVNESALRLADQLDDIKRTFPVALDIDAHHGALRRALARRADIECLVETDLSEAFLAGRAGPRAAADAEFLPFGENSLNLAVSCLSLHWVNDLPGALMQICRALKPDGLFLASMLGGDTLTELRQSLMAAELATVGGVSPRVSPFADVRDAGGLLQRAGFALPVVDADRITVTYPDFFALLRELRGMGETSVLRDRRRTPMRRATLMAAADYYTQNFAAPDGRLAATFQILTLTGWKPHPSQQQPLKPGSGQVSLADALKSPKQQ